MSFEANEASYKHGYYLVDEIYPEVATFVKLFLYPNEEKRLKFKSTQKSAKNDIERAFDVLKRRWQVLSVPARSFKQKKE